MSVSLFQGRCRHINILYIYINECDYQFCYSEGILLVFAIFIFMQNKGKNETQVKLITITYWIKLLLVTQV